MVVSNLRHGHRHLKLTPPKQLLQPQQTLPEPWLLRLLRVNQLQLLLEHRYTLQRHEGDSMCMLTVDTSRELLSLSLLCLPLKQNSMAICEPHYLWYAKRRAGMVLIVHPKA